MKSALLTISISVLALLVWANYPESSLPSNITIEKLVVVKHQRIMSAYSNGGIVKQYQVSLGRSPVGQKMQEGDRKTPEGIFSIDYKKEKSCCYRALHISYPDQRAINRAKSLGVEPGGLVMVHGLSRGFGWLGKLHRFVDWTYGCVAVTNYEMEELYNSVQEGTLIEIQP